MQSLTDGIDGIDGLGRTSSIIVSADGRHVYATGEADNAFAVFSRDNHAANTGFGMLSYRGQAKDNINSVQGMVGASSIAVSPDGDYLYVSGQADNALSRFQRDPWTGMPTWLDQNVHGDSGVAGLTGPLDVRVSKDGNYVYVVSLTDNSLVVFQRNRDFMSPDYGKLRIIQNMIDGVGGVAGLNSPSDMSISPDDQHLYVVTADSVLVIQRLPVLIFGDGFN
jgi:6-phosphogluconolactonase (cycloisomerase 2 family)